MRHKVEILNTLVELAAEGRESSKSQAYRLRAKRLVDDLTEADRMIADVKKDNQSQKYAGFKRATEAILLYLSEHGRPATRDEIAQELVTGGFTRVDKDGNKVSGGEKSVVLKSISSFITGTGRKTGHLKEVNGLIGRSEWEDSLFY